MAAAARRDGRDRDVAMFDEGDLWCSDEAEPALSPSGWYFRPRRGSQPAWVGPYDSEEAAALAPSSGDSLRDARRRLEMWRRGDTPVPPLRAVPSTAPAPSPALEPESPPVAEPETAVPEPLSQPQLALDLDEQGTQPVPTRPRGQRRRDATAEQISFGF